VKNDDNNNTVRRFTVLCIRSIMITVNDYDNDDDDDDSNLNSIATPCFR
jgi:hypothetical protein